MVTEHTHRDTHTHTHTHRETPLIDRPKLRAGVHPDALGQNAALVGVAAADLGLIKPWVGSGGGLGFWECF